VPRVHRTRECWNPGPLSSGPETGLRKLFGDLEEKRHPGRETKMEGIEGTKGIFINLVEESK